MNRLSSATLVLLIAAVGAAAEDAAPLSVKALTAKVRPSVVVISHGSRDGAQQGLGTGFVIDKKGLIATNLHVIGEARPIAVHTAEGKSLPVKAVLASDRSLDLAVVQVDADDLSPLVCSTEPPVDGEAIVVIGNPQGLKHSVVSGVVSGQREIDGRKMLQLAVPVEPGNSGGPVVDMQGRVLGVVTLKSAVTENLGFAVAVSGLKSLIDKPNPVPIDRWLTIGAIDRSQWEPLFGSRWQQRAGRIMVDSAGAGFGGRALLLAKNNDATPPFDVAVTVKLDDEAGAAGLVFHSDGGQKHYGFYPSNGKLRLSRFEGPDVFSWHVLAEKASSHYRPGDWNRLRVHVEKDRLQCFVNDESVIESTDRAFSDGRVGLAKFRNTAAEFRRFAVGQPGAARPVNGGDLSKLFETLDRLPPLAEIGETTLQPLAASAGDASAALLTRAKELQAKADDIKRLAADVRTATVVADLQRLAGPDVAQIDLLRSALTIARLDEEDTDVEAYVKQVDRMVTEIKQRLAADATEDDRLAALNKYLFEDNGFHGSRTDYYHRANSYLSRVIDDREGLPITLSLLYIELGQRLGLKIEGVGLPAHFVVQHVPAKGPAQLIDVFDNAAPLSRESAVKKILTLTGEAPGSESFEAVSHRQMLQRILLNLIGNAQNPKAGPDREALIRYESAMLALDPTSARDRGMRAVCRWETGRTAAAVEDLQIVIDAKPAGLDVDELKRMQDYFRTTKPPARP